MDAKEDQHLPRRHGATEKARRKPENQLHRGGAEEIKANPRRHIAAEPQPKPYRGLRGSTRKNQIYH